MSPKELSYIEDALGHEKFLKSQWDQAAQNLKDPELQAYARELAKQHEQTFSNLYHLV